MDALQGKSPGDIFALWRGSFRANWSVSIQLWPEKLEEYKGLHADPHSGVRDLLVEYHLRNFSIFLQQIEGKWYEL